MSYISRADAIEAVHKYFIDRIKKSKCDYDEELQVYVITKEERTFLTYNKGINDKLRSLPSADTVSRFHHDMEVKELKHQIKDRADAEWIPCSERLPSDDEYVIVSVLDDHGDTPWKYTTVAWLCNGTWIADNDILCGMVVAWKPLPKPYEESEVEE